MQNLTKYARLELRDVNVRRYRATKSELSLELVGKTFLILISLVTISANKM